MDKINALRKIFEGKDNEILGALEMPNGEIAKPGNETLNTIINAHFPDQQETKPTEYPDKQITSEEINNADIPWINEDLLKLVFNGFK